MPRTRKSRTKQRTALALLVGMLLASAAVHAAGPSYAGRSLEEALRDLQSQGLEIFFTSNVVRPGMLVVAEPTAGEPRAILDQLLVPHGLVAEAGPGGRLVVVAAEPSPSSIRGVVRVRYGGEPLVGVRVLIPGSAHQTTTDDDGTFVLADVAAGNHPLEARLPGFVVERVEQVPVLPGRVMELVFELQPAPMALDEIVVTPSSMSLLRDDPVTGLALDRDDIFALPHLGDDIFRAFTLLPGVAGEEASARINVRGGRTDEVLVLLDRVELFEPYHMKDYSSSLSIITPRALSEVNLITGGYPAEYGDRMSGVLDMSTVEPLDRRTLLGLGVLSAEVSSSGTFGDQRGHWLGSVRRGQLDLALEFLGQREQPRYWDAFGKLEYQLRPKQRLGLHLLHSDDRLDYFNIDPDNQEDYRTSYGNSYLWGTHQWIPGSSLFVDSVASVGRVDRDRRAIEALLEPGDEGKGFTVVDMRTLDVIGLKQDWNLELADRHYLKWGFDVRELAADYDYFNLRILDDPLAEVRAVPRTGTTRFRSLLRGEQHSGYLSDRLRLSDSLTAELGLRHDEHTLTADSNLSPRLNLVYALGGATTLRAAWGYFFQSQRPYELQVEDGVTELVSAERTEQRVLSFEHTFASDVMLRVEAYQRKVTDPRPRYENLYEPVSIYPEIEPDRVLFAPETSEARGLEAFLRGGRGRLDWWVSYALSSVEDRIDGRDVPRRVDQRHAFNFDLNLRAGRSWNVNLAWRFHTGWPTTAVTGGMEVDDEGEIELFPVIGPFHAERLPNYHRLDLRASREWQRRNGVLGFYFEIQNLYDRENVAGFDVDFDFELRDDGEIDVVALEEVWGGFLPSFGITWEF